MCEIRQFCSWSAKYGYGEVFVGSSLLQCMFVALNSKGLVHQAAHPHFPDHVYAKSGNLSSNVRKMWCVVQMRIGSGGCCVVFGFPPLRALALLHVYCSGILVLDGGWRALG